MTDLTLLDAIDTAIFRVRERIAAAIVAGDEAANNQWIGEMIRAEVDARLADWRELERPDPVSDEVLTQAFRDVYAAQAAMDRAEDSVWKLAEVSDKRREDAREAWAEMAADMRAHEAGE